MIFLKVHPYWDFLRAEPRFTALLDQLKLDSPPLGAAS